MISLRASATIPIFLILGPPVAKWVVELFRSSGARQLEVGTGTFGYQLAFYQRQGFRVTSIDHDFFVRNYPEPIFESGIQLFDMLRLTLRYSGNGERRLVQAEAARGTGASEGEGAPSGTQEGKE